MAGVVKSTCFALIAIVVIAMAIVPRSEAVTCGNVASYMSPCLPYLTNKGALNNRCCPGVKALYASAKTTADRQTVCNCLKSIAASNENLNSNKVADLPRQCGVSIPYPISPSIDCTKVT